MRIFTIKRIFIFLLLCTVGLVWAIVENAKPLTVKLLNNLLAESHIEVLNFDAEYVSLNHLYIPRLILKIEDSHIAVQEFTLELRDSFQILKNQQLNADDIVSINTQSVYVDLGESFFIRQAQQTEDSPATLQLPLTKLPMINLGKKEVLSFEDGTVITKDKKVSAQFEHTILITDTGYEILTLDPDGKQEPSI